MNYLHQQRTEDRGQRTEHRVPLTARQPVLRPAGCVSQCRPQHNRRAVTLIELLVVISIMMMLAAFALPKLGPMAKQRKIREAARSVNVFLNRARSRAIETGRPCGVAFQRIEDDTNAANMLYQAEVPPPYAGDTESARVTLQGTFPNYQAIVPPTAIQPKILRRNDRIQINGQGPWYTINAPDTHDVQGNLTPDNNGDTFPDGDGIIDGVDPTNPSSPITRLFISVDPQHQKALPWPAAPQQSDPMPFKILRQPTRTIAQPLTLPVGTAVDLKCSGINQIIDENPPPPPSPTSPAPDQTFSLGTNDVIIMFSPNGSVGRYYYDVAAINKGPKDSLGSIYLMIGWRDLIENDGIDLATDEFVDEDAANWQNLSNFWIALNSQSGLVSTSPLAHNDQAYPAAEQTANDFVTASSPSDPVKAKLQVWQNELIQASRQYAQQASSKGGL